ncbi:unnamed protein product [Amoebophrya sp. A120]|nr:unnamed protein product [Amoebophrya sp. A120]|eukprot:GSA120T00016522001.1
MACACPNLLCASKSTTLFPRELVRFERYSLPFVLLHLELRAVKNGHASGWSAQFREAPTSANGLPTSNVKIWDNLWGKHKSSAAVRSGSFRNFSSSRDGPPGRNAAINNSSENKSTTQGGEEQEHYQPSKVDEALVETLLDEFLEHLPKEDPRWVKNFKLVKFLSNTNFLNKGKDWPSFRETSTGQELMRRWVEAFDEKMQDIVKLAGKDKAGPKSKDVLHPDFSAGAKSSEKWRHWVKDK